MPFSAEVCQKRRRTLRMNLLSAREAFFYAALALALLDSSLAYIAASFSDVCTRDDDLSGEWDSEERSHVFQQRAMLLEGHGHRSAARLSTKMSDPPCSLIVQVPRETHVVAVSLYNFPQGIPCPMTLWFHEGANEEEPWSLDLCDGDKKGLLALEIYPNRVTLRWNVDHTLAGKRNKNETNLMKLLAPEKPMEIVVTAVAKGSICEEESRVLCWKMMRESFCVSEELACDGYNNCPRPGNDESMSMCPDQQTQSNNNNDTLKDNRSGEGGSSIGSKPWDLLADHIRRIIAVKTGDTDAAIHSVVNWSSSKRNGSGKKQTSVADTLSVLTSDGEEKNGGEEGENEEGTGGGIHLPYSLGPWTFVLLCMLFCGSILLLCGLWECCCRNGGAVVTLSPPVSPRGSIALASSSFCANGLQSSATRRTTTTTVVIISSSFSSDTPPPPDYDELEQPPDYMDLFPARKTRPVINGRERTGSS